MTALYIVVAVFLYLAIGGAFAAVVDRQLGVDDMCDDFSTLFFILVLSVLLWPLAFLVGGAITLGSIGGMGIDLLLRRRR